uniref:NAC domain-containing protein n=1 Tax=Nelumbo nucifera TaxID=4432 RepID=A0A822YQC0_NELNU|nr:TPA_asm: hypothetical protein HUJ06_010279 [Nelumbo nucifera]
MECERVLQEDSSTFDYHEGLMDLPVGYRFIPTDQELVLHYLLNKLQSKPLPCSVIVDISADELYSKPPNQLGINLFAREELFFFIHYNGNHRVDRMVGDGIGRWKIIGEETSTYSWEGFEFVFKKISLCYYSGKRSRGRRTKWVMVEHHLIREHKECVLGRIKRGELYTS